MVSLVNLFMFARKYGVVSVRIFERYKETGSTNKHGYHVRSVRNSSVHQFSYYYMFNSTSYVSTVMLKDLSKLMLKDFQFSNASLTFINIIIFWCTMWYKCHFS